MTLVILDSIISLLGGMLAILDNGIWRKRVVNEVFLGYISVVFGEITESSQQLKDSRNNYLSYNHNE